MEAWAALAFSARGNAMIGPQRDIVSPGKAALLQAILADIMGDIPTDGTVVLSTTLGVGGTAHRDELDCLRRIPGLLLEARAMEALAACEEALRATASQLMPNGTRGKLMQLRKMLQQDLLTSHDLDLIGEHDRIHLLPRRSVLIGRPSSARIVDIAVNCRWLSRGDRNLSLFCEGAKWFVEDLGSTNGSLMADAALKPGHPLPLANGETRIDVGRRRNEPAPVTVHLHRPALDPGAVVVWLSGGAESAVPAGHAWPTKLQDIARRWVVFREQVAIGAGGECAIRLDSAANGVLAAIRYQSGFWIVPSSQSELRVDGVVFANPVPVGAGSRIDLAGAKFHIEAANPGVEVLNSHMPLGMQESA